MREANGDMNSLLIEDIQGIRLIHGFGLRPLRASLFGDKSGELSRRTLRGMFLWAIYAPVGTFTGQLGIAALVGVAGWQFIHGDKISLGGFFASLPLRADDAGPAATPGKT